MNLEESLNISNINDYAMLIGIAAVSTYLGYKALLSKFQVRKLRKAGIKDQSGLLMAIHRLHKRVKMDNAVEFEETLAVHAIGTFLDPINMTADAIRNLFLRKPNFVSVYLIAENWLKIQLWYDEGTKTFEYAPKKFDRSSLTEAMDYLRSQGYSGGIVG